MSQIDKTAQRSLFPLKICEFKAKVSICSARDVEKDTGGALCENVEAISKSGNDPQFNNEWKNR